ncbi:uncharacterized protein LOC128683819 [Plodia interpunctella]|uniref:uncharacterized protein LOC128683819 n=1 Tax=Plodia interpunctella TaxID=58824 RepID=UPI002368AD35|nr:uncharacterized protein LOC128683819 [Plodia interpunctella]
MATCISPYREMLIKMINAYRKERCLWDITHKDYNSKCIRQEAIDKLLKILRTMEPCADRPDVQKKINSLRTTYRKERKKVVHSLVYNKVVYEPKLWYYNYLTFLDDDNIDGHNDENSDGDVQEIGSEDHHGTDEQDTAMFIIRKSESPQHVEYEESESESNHQLPSSSKRATKRTIDETLTSNVVKLVDKCLKKFKDDDEDRHDIFCKSIAAKMRYLDHKQFILAEKLINDIMYEAESGNLTTEFKLARTDIS